MVGRATRPTQYKLTSVSLTGLVIEREPEGERYLYTAFQVKSFKILKWKEEILFSCIVENTHPTHESFHYTFVPPTTQPLPSNLTEFVPLILIPAKHTDYAHSIIIHYIVFSLP